MTITSPGSCAPAVETMTLSITPLPTANAGADDEVCEDQANYTVSGATSTNGSISWSTSGDGNFTDFAPPSLDNGNVAFWGAGDGQEGIYTDVGGILHNVAEKNNVHRTGRNFIS